MHREHRCLHPKAQETEQVAQLQLRCVRSGDMLEQPAPLEIRGAAKVQHIHHTHKGESRAAQGIIQVLEPR